MLWHLENSPLLRELVPGTIIETSSDSFKYFSGNKGKILAPFRNPHRFICNHNNYIPFDCYWRPLPETMFSQKVFETQKLDGTFYVQDDVDRYNDIKNASKLTKQNRTTLEYLESIFAAGKLLDSKITEYPASFENTNWNLFSNIEEMPQNVPLELTCDFMVKYHRQPRIRDGITTIIPEIKYIGVIAVVGHIKYNYTVRKNDSLLIAYGNIGNNLYNSIYNFIPDAKTKFYWRVIEEREAAKITIPAKEAKPRKSRVKTKQSTESETMSEILKELKGLRQDIQDLKITIEKAKR